MVIFKINIDNLLAVDAEREPPVSRDVQTPDVLSVSGQAMGFPDGDRTQLASRIHVLQERQHLPELICRRRGNSLWVVRKEQATNTLVVYIPYGQPVKCTRTRYSPSMHYPDPRGGAPAERGGRQVAGGGFTVAFSKGESLVGGAPGKRGAAPVAMSTVMVREAAGVITAAVGARDRFSGGWGKGRGWSMDANCGSASERWVARQR